MSDIMDQRRSTNVTLPDSLVVQAKSLKINISKACEAGLAAEVKAAQVKQWLEKNQTAIEQYNQYVEGHGVLLEDYRMF